MRPRRFDNPDMCRRWSQLGGVALHDPPDPAQPAELWCSLEFGWAAYWAGLCGMFFIDTLERNTTNQRIPVTSAAYLKLRELATNGPSDVDPTPTVLFFTGSRHGCTVPQLDRLREWLFTHLVTVAHHGLCIGADYEFHKLCRLMRGSGRSPWIVGYPAVVDSDLTMWPRLKGEVDDHQPPQRPLVRNVTMINRSVLLATPEGFKGRVQWLACPGSREQNGSGTWYTINAAVRLGRSVLVINPDGETTNE